MSSRSCVEYASHWNCHVLPRVGKLQLRRITPQTIARFRADLEADGVGDEAIRRTLAMLHGMLGRAVEWQLIAANPVGAICKPRTERKHAVQAVAPLGVERLRWELAARQNGPHEANRAVRRCRRKRKPPRLRGLQEEPTAGLEPATPSLRVKCSTN
jgi:hypothetical protein